RHRLGQRPGTRFGSNMAADAGGAAAAAVAVVAVGGGRAGAWAPAVPAARVAANRAAQIPRQIFQVPPAGTGVPIMSAPTRRRAVRPTSGETHFPTVGVCIVRPEAPA